MPATAMSKVNVPADTWTLGYSAADSVTVYLQNTSQNGAMLVRVDATASSGDAATAPADILNAYDARSYALVSGDKMFLRPLLPSAALSSPVMTGLTANVRVTA